jgi:5,10-methylenetetrahydromethanopterin reductase
LPDRLQTEITVKIGLFIPTGAEAGELSSVLGRIERAEAQGFSAVWLPNIRAYDALTVLALAGGRTSNLELGTFVVPTYPRHPSALAQQALTVQAATGNRLTLGIGLSHRVTMEGALGLDWSHPIRHTREYLSSLNQLFSGQRARFEGQEYKLRDYELGVPGAKAPPILVAALGPQMLRVAGELSDGTAVWMGGARFLAEHATPTITDAAREAGRPAPRILAGLPICVTANPDAARAYASQIYERYGQLPSYRAVLDREGAAGPGDVSLIGSEEVVLKGLRALETAGATDLAAAPFAPRGESATPTYAFLQELAKSRG